MTGFWAWFHDAWEIVGALGAAAAAGIAVLLASRERVDRKAAESERDIARGAQRTAEQLDARRERERQARQIAVWVDTDVPVSWEWEPDTGQEPKAPKTFLNVTNHSGLPIFDVGPGVTLSPTDRGPSAMASEAPVLPPGESLKYEVFPTVVSDDDPTDMMWVFRDLAGVRWALNYKGVLRALEDGAYVAGGGEDPAP
ncbi:hypothetical protein ACFT2C_06050 [Promicromonospora sp. NPDC057138]|uniref:hypothetical protein n=1 Tax=Promicromonospora sp. NPDC057138 TaxID=3346031 RepID=UPI00364317AE